MPVNSNALIRYKTIDKCLSNYYRKWTLDDLIEACSEALYEYEGIDRGISRRTVQADIQMMRSNKLGYNAPIIVTAKKYYSYEDKQYSITNIPLTNQDLDQLNEAVQFLKQFQGFSHFNELSSMVQKLESELYAQRADQPAAIDYDSNENLKGLNWLDILYKSIIKNQVLEISYQSFKARKPGTIVFHPLLLKEYNNRWFLLGVKTKLSDIINLALDRIIDIKVRNEIPYTVPKSFDPHVYYNDVIGVTVNNERPVNIELYVTQNSAPYVLTKPIHHSQEMIGKVDRGIIIRIKVKMNFELERVLLGFGESIRVIKPLRLRNRIKDRLNYAKSNYESTED